MKVRIKKLCENAVIPSKAHADDAGFDLVATSRDLDDYGCVVYRTGLAFEIPSGYVGLLFPRSSNAKKDLLVSNSVGVIDSGYRGEVTMKFKPAFRFQDGDGGGEPEKVEGRFYDVGDRIGQLIIMPYPEIEFDEVDELSKSERGTGGYGSSGR